ncbi:MaoC family dehydratase, partial [Natronorubrum sp. A-ect3]
MSDTDETSDTDATDDESTEKRLVSGWHGRYYEDFEVGDIYKHPFG